jgi:hypothetical protein
MSTVRVVVLTAILVTAVSANSHFWSYRPPNDPPAIDIEYGWRLGVAALRSWQQEGSGDNRALHCICIDLVGMDPDEKGNRGKGSWTLHFATAQRDQVRVCVRVPEGTTHVQDDGRRDYHSGEAPPHDVLKLLPQARKAVEAEGEGFYCMRAAFWKRQSYFLFTNRDNLWRWVAFSPDGAALVLPKAPWSQEEKKDTDE